MDWFAQIIEWVQSNTGITFLPRMGWLDLLDILFVSFIFYEVLVWFRSTRAWSLFKGVAVLVLVWILAGILKLTMTSWILENTMLYGVLALVVIFQPEIRRALEKLGHSGFFGTFLGGSSAAVNDGLTQESVLEIVSAMDTMSAARTGALICVEQDVGLGEYESTGIPVDATITSQLLINIFEKNTPLHDGAVIISKNRVTSATCYLPLSDNNEISKEMGTRHRAALGLSEVSDAIVLVVSEETGALSVARGGQIYHGVDRSFILNTFRTKESSNTGAISFLRKFAGALSSEEKGEKND